MTGYFVWAGGRWRELDARSGRVAGWRGRARFVCRARGRLQLTSTGAVLRHLRALLAGQPSAVKDGAPLSQRRRRRSSNMQKALCTACSKHQHCCESNANKSCINNNAPNAASKEPPIRVETAVQVTLPSRSLEAAPPRPPPRPPRAKRARSTSSEPMVIRQQVRVDVHRSSSEEPPRKRPSTNSSNIPVARKQTQSSQATLKQTQSSQSHCKELVINEEDVDLYRSYLIKHDPTFNVYRFDTDENYKLRVFFRINPLVNVERCARIERMLRVSQSSQEMSLKDFATKLGLRSISDKEERSRYKMRKRAKVVELSSDEETDKENLLVPRKEYSLSMIRKRILEGKKEKERDHTEPKPRRKLYGPLSRRNVLQVQQNKEKEKMQSKSAKGTSDDKIEVVSRTTSDSDFVSKRPVPPKRPEPIVKAPVPAVKPVKLTAPKVLTTKVKRKSGGGLNAYSNLEDHAIVAWVSAGLRARLVNGNRLWRELQAEYRALTGTSRSWHSLRNRYLRYILPALPALALPAPHAARLRAAAAAGELKSKGRASRRNSIFAQPAVRSASARSRFAYGQTSDTQRVLRSSAAHESPDAHTSPTKRGRTDHRRPDQIDNKPAPDATNRRGRSANRSQRRSSSTESSEPKTSRSNRSPNKSSDRSKNVRKLPDPQRSDSSDESSEPKIVRPNRSPEKSSDKLKNSKKVCDRSNKRVSSSGSETNKSVDRNRSRKQQDVQSDSSLEEWFQSSEMGSKNKSPAGKDKTPLERNAKGRFLPRSRSEGRGKRNRDRSSHSLRDRSNHRSENKSNRSRDGLGKLLKKLDLNQSRDESEDRRASLRARNETPQGVKEGRSSRTPTYDQLTRQFATRLRSTPIDVAFKNQQAKAKTRKLYNPN